MMAIDVCNGYADLREHVGHDVEIVQYGNFENVAIECTTCGEVLIDFTRDESDMKPIVAPDGRLLGWKEGEEDAGYNKAVQGALSRGEEIR
jgi:hypothetical protein